MAYELYPAVDEGYNFPPEVREALAASTELRNTVLPLTQTQRNNLTGPDLWDGRLVLNTTTDRLNRYDAGTSSWKPIADGSEVTALSDSVDETFADRLVFTNKDPVVNQSSTWTLGDFTDGTGHSGNTAGVYKVVDEVVECWQLAVQNGNGPSFPPAAAQKTYVDVPVPTNIPSRWLMGTWLYMSYTEGVQAEGVLRYDDTLGDGKASLSQFINSNNQYSLALYWRYPIL